MPDQHTFHVVTWNVQNSSASSDAIDVLIKEWGEHVEWDVAIVQELKAVDAYHSRELDSGHTVILNPLNNAIALAIIVHRRWKWLIMGHQRGRRAATVTLKTTLGPLHVVGVHLTPEGYGRQAQADNDVKWKEDLHELQPLIQGMRGRMILAGDWNARMGVRRQHGKVGGIGRRDPRGDILWEWLSARGLTATHLGFEDGSKYSRHGKMGRRLVSSLIDYVFYRAVGTDSITDFSHLDNALLGKTSDHACITCTISYGEAIRERGSIAAKRWYSGQKAVFWQTLQAARPPAAEDSLHQVMLDIGTFAAPRARQHRADTPVEAELRELERLRRMATDNGLRKTASKMIFKYRRAQRRLRFAQELRQAAHAGRTGPCSKKNVTKAMNHAIELRDLQGQTRPRSDWHLLIDEFFTELFSTPAAGELPPHVWEAHPDAEAFTTSDVSEMLWTMRRNAWSSPAEDGIMLDLMIGAPLWFHELLCELFTRRMRGAWSRAEAFHALAMLLAKRKVPETMAHFRPIVLLPTVLKLFDRLLLQRLTPELEASFPPWVCGFRKHRQPADLLSAIHSLITKSHEWQRPLLLIKCDAFKAFDSIAWPVAYDALSRRCPAHQAEVAVLVREHAGTEVTYCLRDRACSATPARCRGFMQGQGSSPAAWNAVQAETLEPWAVDCERLGYGYRMDEANAIWIVGSWADDNIVAAEGHAAASHMLAMLHDRSQAGGWRLAWEDTDKCQWMQNEFAAALPGAGVVTNPMTLQELKRVDSMKILGVTFAMTDTQPFAVECRQQATWANFRMRRSLFTQRSICRFSRLRMLDLVLRPTLLWGLTVMSLRGSELERIRKTMMSLICYAVGLQKHKSEDWHSWTRRRRVDQVVWARAANMVRWDQAACRFFWLWAGHVARMPVNWPASLCFFWKGWLWQEMHAMWHRGNVRGHTGSTAIYWQSERAVIDFLWDDHEHAHRYWRDVAADKAEWGKLAAKFAAARTSPCYGEQRLDGSTSGETVGGTTSEGTSNSSGTSSSEESASDSSSSA